MATVNPQPVENVSGDGSAYRITWLTLTNVNVDGAPIGGTHGGLNIVRLADKTVQFVGTFGGATVALQGSNDGVNWESLTDPQGNAISKTSAALETVTENTLFIRPLVSGGGGTTDIDVYLVAVLNNDLRT